MSEAENGAKKPRTHTKVVLVATIHLDLSCGDPIYVYEGMADEFPNGPKQFSRSLSAIWGVASKSR
jgi:hypothetical protein